MTMLVWMTGELDYAGLLYPKKKDIQLLKSRDSQDNPLYVGDLQKTEYIMQFAGELFVNEKNFLWKWKKSSTGQ